MSKAPDRIFINPLAYTPEVLKQWSQRFTDNETEYIRADLAGIQWVKCSERLPEVSNTKCMLILDTIGKIDQASLIGYAHLGDKKLWKTRDFKFYSLDSVTHWAEINLPTEEQ